MLEQVIYSLGNPGTFDPDDKDDPQYYIARFSHEMSVNFYNLQQEGFNFYQEEDTDFTAFENAYDTYATTLQTWMDTAVGESMDGDPISAVPAIPDITTLLPWISGNPWLVLLVKIGIDILVRWLRQKLDPGTESKEIARVLKQALIGENGESEEFPLLELLTNTPIKIILSRFNEFQEFLYENPSA